MKNSFYIHISSNTLAHYIVGGCICPVSLIERREDDFQNNYADQIILSTKKWNKSSDCSIEVILNSDEEVHIVQLSSDYLLYNSIIPISRIKAIFFSEKEKAEGIIWNINAGAGFVSDRLINYSSKNEEDLAQNLSLESRPRENKIDELKKVLKRFDRLLGGIAFLRTSIIDIDDFNINYPMDYFSTLSFFNKKIESELINAKLNYNPFLHKIFTGESIIFKYIGQKIDDSTVENISQKENIPVEAKFGVINLKEIPVNSLTFKVAVLNTYGKDKVKSVEDLLNILFKELETEIKEEIALVYGLYVGYKSLRNFYKIGNRELIVKYKLDSKMDYYIIESLFQYSFYDRKISENFEYLNPILPTKEKASAPVDYKIDYLLDETIVTKKKDYSESLKNMIQSITSDITKWFSTDVFKIDSKVIEQKLELILKSKFNTLVEEVKFDSKQSFINENIKKETEKALLEKSEKLNLIENIEDEVENSTASVLKDKGENNISEIDIESMTHPTADKLYSMTLKELKVQAKKRSIKIPSSMKKEDIVMLILSNNELEL